MKQNGQLWASLRYVGNNTFEGGAAYPKASFELQKDGTVKVVVLQKYQHYKRTVEPGIWSTMTSIDRCEVCTNTAASLLFKASDQQDKKTNK